MKLDKKKNLKKLNSNQYKLAWSICNIDKQDWVNTDYLVKQVNPDYLVKFTEQVLRSW